MCSNRGSVLWSGLIEFDIAWREFTLVDICWSETHRTLRKVCLYVFLTICVTQPSSINISFLFVYNPFFFFFLLCLKFSVNYEF